jgi:hypothetical protein
VKYLCKWLHCPIGDSTWEFDNAIVDRSIKSRFDKHVRDNKLAACKGRCKCVASCLCNDAVELQKALDSQN